MNEEVKDENGRNEARTVKCRLISCFNSPEKTNYNCNKNRN